MLSHLWPRSPDPSFVPQLSNVLLVTSTFPKSEDDPVTARFVLDLALHLSAHVRVTVLAPSGPGLPGRQLRGDVQVLRHRYFLPASAQRAAGGDGLLATARGSLLARVQLPLLVASQWAVLLRVVRSERIQLVNSHWLVPQGLNAALWKSRLGFAHVATAHAADVALLARMRGGAGLARWIMARTDAFLPVSTELARQVEDLVGHPVPHRVVPMGVSAERFRPAGDGVRRAHPGERVVLFVGKLLPKKGVGVLLEALDRLRRRGVRARLTLVGGGPLETEIRASVARLELGDAVDLRGWIRNDALPPLFAGADVVCVPSVRDARGETEGLPVVLQEAMATGCVVVASRIAGIPDLIRDGENGWLAPPGDADGLADALARALAMDEPHERAMRESARRTAQGHTWQRVAESYMDAFATAMTASERSA